MISPGPFCFHFFNYILFELIDDKCISANSESGSDHNLAFLSINYQKREVGRNGHSFQMDLLHHFPLINSVFILRNYFPFLPI